MKLVFRYKGKDGHIINFDYINLYETLVAASKLYNKMHEAKPDLEEYIVTFCEDGVTEDGVEIREDLTDLHIG